MARGIVSPPCRLQADPRELLQQSIDAEGGERAMEPDTELVEGRLWTVAERCEVCVR